MILRSGDQAAAGCMRGQIAAGQWTALNAASFARFGRLTPRGTFRWVQVIPKGGNYDIYLVADDTDDDPFARARRFPRGATYVDRTGLEGMLSSTLYIRAYDDAGEPADEAVTVEIWAGFAEGVEV